ncbi:MAG: hypothetical protein HQL37_10250 [Alphaproteobacteria bacterium]|nr:hypothetical protein [Alphaproteobacteria bacterium]
MADETVCDYTVPGEVSDDEAYAIMVEAFASNLIVPNERLPVLRLFTGETDLVFAVTADGDRGEPVTNAVSRASTLRLSPEVQRKLTLHFAHWLNAN